MHSGLRAGDQRTTGAAAVKAKEDQVNAWRGMSKAATDDKAMQEAKDALAAQTKKVEDVDSKIREAAKPRWHHYEIVIAN